MPSKSPSYNAHRLSPQHLSHPVPSSQFPIGNSSELEPLQGILGQDRAVEAIQFGAAIKRKGFNIFMMGETGCGRSSFIREYLQGEAKRQATPCDWLYVNDFDKPLQPLAIELPAGSANDFKKSIIKLIDDLVATIPASFEHPSFQRSKAAIERDFNQRYDKALVQVEQAALERKIALFRDEASVSFTPMIDGKGLDETEFAQLPEAEREAVHAAIDELETLLNDRLLALPQWKRESSANYRKLSQKTISRLCKPLFEPLEQLYAAHPKLLSYIKQVRQRLNQLIPDKLFDEKNQECKEASECKSLLEDEFIPNIFISREPSAGMPVIFEAHPSYKNLFGRIESSAEPENRRSCYHQLCPGALHRANGGYLILEANKLLGEPMVWEALKRALSEQCLKIEPQLSDLGLLTQSPMTPQDIKLQTKLVLIGSRSMYYLLLEIDPDFNELFRVLADFDERIARNDDNLELFARLMHSFSLNEDLQPLKADAIARLAEHSCRMAEHQHYLSANFKHSIDLLAEADFIRNLALDEFIQGVHIERAKEAITRRGNRVHQQQLEQTLNGNILIDTQGEAVGKINALTVYQLGDNAFGSPARITATLFPGSRGVVDIEREASLGQALHSKGVMILNGFLGQRYARDFPLAVSANLAMEQSYGLVDGDSASLAELCCLISTITETPIKQGFAMTGSVNQFGEIQAVGGVNEKIEGFFDLCLARSLNSHQGVIIPRANLDTLMLKPSVIEAVSEQQFHIYAIEHVDQALELLTGVSAGEIDCNGRYPEHSINAKAISRLAQISSYSHRKDDSKK